MSEANQRSQVTENHLPATRSRFSNCIVLFMMTIGCHGQPGMGTARPVATQYVSNLRAFAKAYGLVRWFHPSDAAAMTDWNRFAIDGVRRVFDAPDAASLRARLMAIFAPIAPTMHILREGEQIPDESELQPKLGSKIDVVAWQHKGYGDSTMATGYASKRLHRDRTVAVRGTPFAALSQAVDAAPLRGSLVRLRGKLRTLHHSRGQLWLRVDRGDLLGFFDNMAQRPVINEAWTSAEIIGKVAADATRVVFGELMSAAEPGATVWYDDLELSVQATDGTWKPLNIRNGGFEDPELFASWHPGVGRSSTSAAPDGWNMTIDHNLPASGKASLRIEPIVKVVSEDLFAQAPTPGEVMEADLGEGLRVRVPITLYSQDGHTLGDASKIDSPSGAKHDGSASSAFDLATNIADLIVFWNVFAHFWPYWDTISTNWDSALSDAISESLNNANAVQRNANAVQHVATLERLSAEVPDGHIGITCLDTPEFTYLPFAVDFIENQVVVTASEDALVKRGDIIIAVDASPAQQLLAAEIGQISGSSQWRTVRALQRFARGPAASRARLRIRRDHADVDITVARVENNVSEDPTHSAIEHFDDGYYYIDMSRATMEDIAPITDRLAAAPGLVLDFRRYPKHNHELLTHIITRIDDLKGWELIPLITHPDSPSRPAAWEDTSTWNMPLLTVHQPHIGGRVAILTGPEAISYAESVLALVAHYHIGEIFGAPTAGTNGDVAQIDLPSGCSTLFTGRRVLNPDGSRFHLLGIQPTVPVSRTIAGVAAGRDEVLERALANVRTGAR